MKKRGISLIVLVITIIVISILATAIIFTLLNNNTLDQSKKAKFMSDYRTVQEGVNLFSLSKYNAETNEFELPLKGYLTDADKTYITDNVPTLKTKIEELSGTLDTVNLAWISSEDIGVKLTSNKAEKGYILDVAKGLIYDYNGDYFEGQMWHTLDGGVASTGTPGTPSTPPVDYELWDGWIKLTLYYPPNSTEKQWRLGTEGELRADPMLMWQNYIGPITIPLDRVKDVWIKYKLDNKEVVIPPAGTLLVDIVPDKTGYAKVPGVKVHINFDETATIKEYRIGDSNWMPYAGEFNVTENCIIEARAKKTETIYNTDGTVLTTRNIAGRDLVYIGNIGIEETELPAPTITRLIPTGTEKARVQVTYPANADKKIYKVNYGIEENYTTEINVQSYGTYILAYYYDASGKRSKAAGIRINDTSTGTTPEPPGPYNPLPPYDPGTPLPPYDPGPYGINIPAPTVVISPTSVVEQVQVSINAPTSADKIYIKLGRYGDYQLYTAPVTVRENMDIYAYYRTYAGEKSDTAYGRVNNIKKNNRPYVRIDADPYPYSWSYGAEEVNVTINYSDATTIEYSEDGVVYTPYTSAFKVTENKTIYARGTNSYGVTETSLNITNIGKIKPPTPIGNLAVGINVNPEPTVSEARYLKATVSIDYDSKATEKYYRIGTYGDLKAYTGTFEVTSNCTIYAYAKGTNATGSTAKTVDNLSSGISEPIIATQPGNGEQSSKVSVTIAYDKYSKIKRYSINGGTLIDYGGTFEVTKNGSVVYAYSENDVGQKAESRYTINNIVPDPPVLLLDKGQYYLLKLNYPEGSKNREYKWKESGTWGLYKEAGILLLKPQYKDQLIQNGTLVKIQDEAGNLVTFTGDYYFIDVPISELFENLFMRWDREPLGAPQIVITPAEPAMQVTANIVYNPNLIKKQYKVVNPDGSIKTDWKDYTGPITIDRNNSVVYAKGMDDSEVWTPEAMKKIINIDENAPVITLTADLTTAQQKVAVKVAVTDDVAVGKIKWAVGVQGESYFASAGTEVANNSVVNITSNNYYTFYAEDQVGNKQVYTLNVANVDLTAPAIDIQVTPETTVGLTANVTINYGDAVSKQYKVGTSNATWTNYTTSFEISSYTILSNNWQNADGTVTIYAKGKDAANNEVTVQKKVVNLDLDKINLPVIQSNAGYPILRTTGVDINASTSITYDTRTDIDNYYSVDNGATWRTYTGSFNYASGTIIAKSVKKSTGLEAATSKTVTMPSFTIGPDAYDGNITSYYRVPDNDNYYKISVEDNMQGKYFIIKWTSEHDSRYVTCLGASNNELVTYACPTSGGEQQFYIPVGTKSIAGRNYGLRIHEIKPGTTPVVNPIKNNYATLTTTGITKGYTQLTITYFPTSIQRLYKIGVNGIWKSYEDQEIRLIENETIYAKGIDQYGNESYIISYKAPVISTQIGPEAYDNNISTYYRTPDNYIYYKIAVDPTMQGKYAKVIWTSEYSGRYIACLDNSNRELATIGCSTNEQQFYIPTGTTYLGAMYLGLRIQEVKPGTTPIINATKTNYAVLTLSGVTRGYTQLTISYFPTSVQRLYKIGINGTWQSYEDKPINLTETETIYAKGIDQFGDESTIISYTAPVAPNQMEPTAYDNDLSTYYRTPANDIFYKIAVDPSMQGKYVKMIWTTEYSNRYIACLDNTNKVLATYYWNSNEQQMYIPTGTTYFAAMYYGIRIQEIKPGVNPTIVPGKTYYPKLTSAGILNGYTELTIIYFPTSVQRLYKIGINGEWKPYENVIINLNERETIYTKAIDQYGQESTIISYTAPVLSDQIGPNAYDGNLSTVYRTPDNYIYYKIVVDPSMYGKYIKVNWTSEYGSRYIACLNASNGEIAKYGWSANEQQMLIPTGTVNIGAMYLGINIKEIEVVK